MDIPRKADIQNINVMIHQFQLFSDRHDIITLFYIIAEKFRHILYIFIGPVGAFHHGQLWEKKKIKKKDEKTGEEIEVEDYDWEAITKAVKSFVEDYNDVVEQAGNSNSKDVLRNAVWMTGITESNENMLSKIGITVGKGNKLELDEEALKKADISSFKTLFTGHNSFADKVSMKANSISNAAARTSGTYKSNGTYNNALSELVSKKVDEEV